jgi:hypothetical protein
MEISTPIEYSIVSKSQSFEANANFSSDDFNESLDNKKFIVDYVKMDNSQNPQFCPRLRDDVIPTPAVFTPGDTVNMTLAQTVNQDYTDYFIYLVRNPSGNPNPSQNVVANVKWENNLYPKPPTLNTNPAIYYSDRYYQINDVSYFLGMIEKTFKAALVLAYGQAVTQLFNFTVSPNDGFGLQIELSFFEKYFLYFSPKLNELFNFKINTALPTLGGFVPIEFKGESTVSIWNVDCLTTINRYVSKHWLPYNEIIITSDLPLINVRKHSNLLFNRQYNKTEKNVVLSFYPLNTNPINTNPQFIYETQSSNTKYNYFYDNGYDKNLFNMRVFLYNSVYDISFPYLLNVDEEIILKCRLIQEQNN